MSRSTHLAVLALIVLLGVALRSYELTARSIWFDEAFTWRLIQFPFTELIASTSHDVHPPLYYLLLKLWALVFGSSLVSLRALSIATAALLITLAYGFVRNIFGRPGVGLLAALFIAISPWQIALSTEARMYTLAAALSLGTVWALYRRQWIIFTVGAIALAYTHYYGLLFIVATSLWWLGYLLVSTRARLGEIFAARLLWYGLAAYLTILLAYLPWLPVLLRQTRQVSQSFWIPPLTRWSLPETLYRMALGVTAEPRHDTLLPLLLVVALFVWLLVWKKSRAASALLITAISGTLAASMVASVVSQSIYQDRYFLLIHSFLLIVLAIGLSSLKPRWLAACATSACIVFFLFSTRQHYQRLDLPHHTGVRGALEQLARHQQPNEPIVVGSSFIFFPVLHYQQEELVQLPMPRLYSESPTLSHFAGGPILQTADIVGPEFFKETTRRALWVIDTSGFGGSNIPVPAGWVKTSEAVFPEVFPYQGEVFVKHYEPASRVR